MSINVHVCGMSRSSRFVRRLHLVVPYDAASIENGYSPVKVRDHL